MHDGVKHLHASKIPMLFANADSAVAAKKNVFPLHQNMKEEKYYDDDTK
jgi:hypothetical protein